MASLWIATGYLPPDAGGEGPIELVTVTETVPMALVSPEYPKGRVSENAPPLATPRLAPVSENHAVAAAVRETVN